MAVSRVLQGATGRLTVQRRKARQQASLFGAETKLAAKPSALADRTNKPAVKGSFQHQAKKKTQKVGCVGSGCSCAVMQA